MSPLARAVTIGAALFAAAALPGAASAGTVTGTYSLRSPGRTPQTDQFSTPASASWKFSFRAGGQQDGSGWPATLTAAHQDPYSQPCSDDPEGGAITSSVDGVVDPDARISVIPYFNVRAGRGKVVVTATNQPGTAQGSTDRHCAPPLDSDNGVSTSPFDVGQLFGTLPNEGDFALVRQHDGSWMASGSKQLSQGDVGAPMTATATVRLVGSVLSFNSYCHVPTKRELRGARSVKAAVAILKAAGFPKPFVQVSDRSGGHYYVDASNRKSEWDVCGPRSVTLLQTGSGPPGQGGHGGLSIRRGQL
jgi:hypothetical protein